MSETQGLRKQSGQSGTERAGPGRYRAHLRVLSQSKMNESDADEQPIPVRNSKFAWAKSKAANLMLEGLVSLTVMTVQ
jgi:hypothetical protein